MQGQPKGHVAGFAVTANFFPLAEGDAAQARLLDADGNEVECWLSTPEKPLPNTGTIRQIRPDPEEAAGREDDVPAAMSAEADGQPWSAEWTLHDAGPEGDEKSASRKHLCEEVNRARAWAGLEPVVLEEKQSAGCRLHAKYVVRNLDHPKVAGAGDSRRGHEPARRDGGGGEGGQGVGDRDHFRPDGLGGRVDGDDLPPHPAAGTRPEADRLRAGAAPDRGVGDGAGSPRGERSAAGRLSSLAGSL